VREREREKEREKESKKEGILRPVVLTTIIFLSMVNVVVLHHVREWYVKPVVWYSVISWPTGLKLCLTMCLRTE
jgi:hypothetical protein